MKTVLYIQKAKEKQRTKSRAVLVGTAVVGTVVGVLVVGRLWGRFGGGFWWVGFR